MSSEDKNDNSELYQPGKELKRIREEKSLTIEAVASRLRLDKSMIVALESDNYEPFAASTYVRGYIRGYAKYLDIESAPLVRRFDQVALDAPALSPYSSTPEPQMKSSDKHVQIITFLIITIMLASLIWWWKTSQTDTTPVISSIDATNLQPNEAIVEGENTDQYSTVIVTNDEPLTRPFEDLQTYPTEQKDLEHDYGMVTYNTLPEPTEPEAVEVQDFESEVTTQSEESQPLPDIATFEADQKKAAEIVIKLKDVSWIQITDANDIHKYSGLAGPDEEINVYGEPPLRVILGKADAISGISFADQKIDLTPLTRGDVARFFVDESGAYR